MEPRPFQRLLVLLALAFFMAGPAHAAPAQLFPAPVPECRQALSQAEEEDSWPAFLAEREKVREKFETLESVSSFPAEMHGMFDAKVKLLSDPEDALAAKVLLIRNAKESIDIAHFILKTDRVGRIVVSELKQAVLRGVSIRVLVDSYGSASSISGIVSDLKALLAANHGPSSKRGHVEVVIFNPQMHLSATVKKWFTKLKNLFRKPEDKLVEPRITWNNHLHDKIVAADLHLTERAVAIMGGRGIEDIYYAFPEYGPKTFRDMEFVIRNPHGNSNSFELGTVLGTYFDSLYYHLGNKFLSLGFRNFLGKPARKRLMTIEALAAADLYTGCDLACRIDRLGQHRFLEDGFEAASVQFVHESENALRTGIWRDDLEHDRYSASNPGSLTVSLRDHLKEADETVDIVTPYAWFPPEEIRALRDWADAKPTRKIRVITNSVATGDSLLAQALVDAEVGPAFMKSPDWKNARKQIVVLSYGRLNDARYGGPVWYGRLHSKYFLFDRKLALITSYNADPRSRYWSTESGFYINSSRKIVEDLNEDADHLADMSTEWGSPEWFAVRNHPANEHKTQLQNLLGRIMRVLRLSPLV